jgi:hypothetical protein
VNFTETLASLLEWVGRRVIVHIESPAPGIVARLDGVLESGSDLSRSMMSRQGHVLPEDPVGAVFFHVGDAGFMVDPKSFSRAGLYVNDRLLRIDDRAGVVVSVELAG